MALADVKVEVDKILYHLNTANHALNGNETDIARSQYKQYFTSWDRVDDVIHNLYPEQCKQISLTNGRIERSLLRQPQNLEDARMALHELRDIFLDIVQKMDNLH